MTVSRDQKDTGLLLIICINQLLGYMVFLCFVPIWKIKWILIDNVVPVSVLNIVYNKVLDVIRIVVLCCA